MSEPPDDAEGVGQRPSDPDEPADGPPDVGSVADEALKLFGALSEWARDHGSDLGSGVSGLADQAAQATRDVNEHLATGSPECTYCPICRTVHVVRQASPEVRAQLALAASSLLQAAVGVLAGVAASDQRSDRRATGVERIDLDDDQPWPEGDDA